MEPRNSRGRRKKGRANRGSFRPGPDPRRHKFTAQDCRIGYWVAAIKHPECREWLLLRIRIYYSNKERQVRDDAQAAERCCAFGGNPEPLR